MWGVYLEGGKQEEWPFCLLFSEQASGTGKWNGVPPPPQWGGYTKKTPVLQEKSYLFIKIQLSNILSLKDDLYFDE